jgi:4-hydroxy-3-polyprenylbenzoate decarboxylase
MALADAEIVLEGYVNPRDRRFETKEAEDPACRAATISIRSGRAIWENPTRRQRSTSPLTMRKPASKPIVLRSASTCWTTTTSTPRSRGDHLRAVQPPAAGIIQDVVIPYSMTDWGGCIIQVKKRHQIDEGWQRSFLGAILSCSQGMRLAIAVSEDVILFDGRRDVVPDHARQSADRHPQPDPRRRPDLHAGRAHDRGRPAMDRVEHPLRGGMGIDATVPFSYESDFSPVYPVDKVKPRTSSRRTWKTPSRGWSAGSIRWRRPGDNSRQSARGQTVARTGACSRPRPRSRGGAVVTRE